MFMNQSDSLTHYLNNAAKILLLTPEEEIRLGKQVQAMQALTETNPEGPYTKTQTATMRRGKRATDRMVSANLRLVMNISRKYATISTHLGVPFEDLVQEGNIGLIRAVQKYDPTRGYKFSTYAYWWVRQAVTRYMQSYGRMIRLPGHIHDRFVSINRLTAELTALHGRAPSIERLLQDLDMTRPDYDLIMHRAAKVASLDVLAVEDGQPLLDLIADESISNEQSLDDIQQLLYADQLDGALSQLKDNERRALVLRYGLEGNHQHTYRELGESHEFNVSRERIRQIVDCSLRKVRQYLSRSKAFSEPREEPLCKPWTLSRSA